MKTTLNSSCPHKWRRVYEQSLVAGYFPIGWECLECGTFVNNAEVTPDGLPGTLTGQHRLIGVHGGAISTASGTPCRSQVWNETTKELSYD